MVDDEVSGDVVDGEVLPLFREEVRLADVVGKAEGGAVEVGSDDGRGGG